MFSFDFLTIEMLATPLGMVLAVSLITQFTKDLWDRIKKIPTKYIVYLYSEILIFVVAYLTLDLAQYNIKDWVGLILVTVLNGIVVAMASMKSYEQVESYILKKVDNKTQ